MSSNQHTFLAIVMHYVNNDWQSGTSFIIYCLCTFLTVYLEELLIDFCKLIGHHSGENMALAAWETLKLYGLKGKVRSPSIIIGDNPSRCLLSIVMMPQTMTHFWNRWSSYMWVQVMILMPKRATFVVCLIPSTWRQWRQVTMLSCMYINESKCSFL